VTVPILRKWLAVCLGLYSQRHLGLGANDCARCRLRTGRGRVLAVWPNAAL